MDRADVIGILQDEFRHRRTALDATKVTSSRWGRHDDWPWNGIILSAATRGGSARWERNVAPRYEAELSWAALGTLSAQERRRRFETVGRFWRRTADWLEGVYQHILEAGGPAEIRAMTAPMDAEAIIAFWTAFPDVGDKYARNIMMDIYDARFRDAHFAVDSRIKSLLPGLGFSGRNRYAEQEAFLAEIAREAGIEGWELDRLLYQAHDRLKERLRD